MSLIRNKLILKIVIILNILLLIVIFYSIKNKSAAINDLEQQLLIKENQFQELKKSYLDKRNQLKQEQDESSIKLNLQQKAAQITKFAGQFNLKLNQYSSSEEEIILNLNGEYSEIYSFIKALEEKWQDLKIYQLRLSKDKQKLLLILKIVELKS